jgi:hypothetical protein
LLVAPSHSTWKTHMENVPNAHCTRRRYNRPLVLSSCFPPPQGINHSYNLTRNLAVVIARIQSFQSELWNCPGQIKRDSWEFQRGLATSLVALAPIAPHFAAEMWERLCQVSGRVARSKLNKRVGRICQIGVYYYYVGHCMGENSGNGVSSNLVNNFYFLGGGF